MPAIFFNPSREEIAGMARSNNEVSGNTLPGYAAHDRSAWLVPPGCQADERRGFPEGKQHFTTCAASSGEQQAVSPD